LVSILTWSIPFTNFHLSFPSSSCFFFIIIFCYNFHISFSNPLMKTHFWSYFKFIMMNYYRDFLHIFIIIIVIFYKSPTKCGSLYEQHSRFTFLKHKTFNPTTDFLNRGSYRVMIDGVCPSLNMLFKIPWALGRSPWLFKAVGSHCEDV
jgi:hypothetical protein